MLHFLFHGCVLVRENEEFKTPKTCFCEKVLHFLFHGCILVRGNQEFRTLKTYFFEKKSVTFFVPWMYFSSRKPKHLRL